MTSNPAQQVHTEETVTTREFDGGGRCSKEHTTRTISDKFVAATEPQFADPAKMMDQAGVSEMAGPVNGENPDWRTRNMEVIRQIDMGEMGTLELILHHR